TFKGEEASAVRLTASSNDALDGWFDFRLTLSKISMSDDLQLSRTNSERYLRKRRNVYKPLDER
ncbi:hypothetical protein C0J52_20044, partial [Blattella germanica]